MGLALVIGDRSAGKTGVLYERVRDAAKRGLSVAVLLPNASERDRALREFSTSLPVGATIETLDAFLDGWWSVLGDGRRRIGEIERQVVLEAVLERLQPQLGDAIPRSAAMRVLRVLVQRSAEQPRSMPAASAVDPLARTLASVIEAYEDELQTRGLIEEAAARRAAARWMTRGALPDVVCVNRFETFTPPQMAFLESAIRAGIDVLVALTHVEGSDATRAVAGLLERLKRYPGARVIEVASSPPGTSEELIALQSSLAGVERRAVATGAVRLAAVSGSRGEAGATAAAVRELADSGISVNEIAVVARNMRKRSRRLVAALDAVGIPWRYEGAWELRDSGLGRAAVSLVRLVAERRREHLANFLQSGYAGVSDDEADLFLRGLRMRRTPQGDETRLEAEAAPGRAGWLIREAFAVFDRDSGAATVDALGWITGRMMRNRHGVAPGLERGGRLDAKARQAILDCAVAVSGATGRLDAASLARVLQGVSVPGDDRTVKGVVVTSMERVRARRFDAVVLLGMTADEFPRAEAGLGLPRRTLRDLERLGIDAAPRFDLDDERLLFYQVITGARQRLMLIWQMIDDDGVEQDPSLFVEELLDAYEPSCQPKVAGPGADADMPTLGGSTAGASVGTRVGSRHVLIREVRHDLPEDVAETLARRTAFSASELEAYLRCPRRWFYERELRPVGIDTEIDARARGRVAHAILQRFYEQWQDMGNPRVTPAMLSRALEIHAEVAADVLRQGPTPESLEERAEMERAVVGTRRVIERDAASFEGFAPVGLEFTFGLEGCDTVACDGWQLKGRIDRVDAGPAGLIVLDYKTGGGAGAARFEDKRILQAPLYSHAAATLYGRPVVGMVYRTMGMGRDRGAYIGGVVSSPWLAPSDAQDVEAMDALITRALERATEAVKGIRSGDIRPEPYEAKECALCIARTWCEGSRA